MPWNTQRLVKVHKQHSTNTQDSTVHTHKPSKHLYSTFYIKQESHAVAGKPRDAAVNSDRYQQPVGQKQSE